MRTAAVVSMAILAVTLLLSIILQHNTLLRMLTARAYLFYFPSQHCCRQGGWEKSRDPQADESSRKVGLCVSSLFLPFDPTCSQCLITNFTVTAAAPPHCSRYHRTPYYSPVAPSIPSYNHLQKHDIYSRSVFPRSFSPGPFIGPALSYFHLPSYITRGL